MLGSVVLVLHGHMPWVLHHGRWPHGETWLFEAALGVYHYAGSAEAGARSPGVSWMQVSKCVSELAKAQTLASQTYSCGDLVKHLWH